MGAWFPVSQDARVSTRLDGVVEGERFRRNLTVLSLSEGGFYGEGFDLDEVDPEFRIRLDLNPRGPTWSPVPGVAGWRSRMLDGLASQTLILPAGLLYLDLAAREREPRAKVGLGGRFADIGQAEREQLREFIARERFRAREWRTAGGAVPVVRRMPLSAENDH